VGLVTCVIDLSRRPSGREFHPLSIEGKRRWCGNLKDAIVAFGLLEGGAQLVVAKWTGGSLVPLAAQPATPTRHHAASASRTGGNEAWLELERLIYPCADRGGRTG
jgi:hypothetical protein